MHRLLGIGRHQGILYSPLGMDMLSNILQMKDTDRDMTTNVLRMDNFQQT